MEPLHYGMDWDYARSRLKGSVIKYLGKPVFVDAYYDNHVVNMCYLGDDFWFVEKFSPETFDLSPVKLGYSNIMLGITYLARIPARYWKQGLTQETLFSSTQPVSITSREVRDTILGVYPKISACCESILCEESNARAFSRNFALGREKDSTFKLLFREKPVGFMTWNYKAENVNIELKEDYQFLAEMLQDEVKNV